MSNEYVLPKVWDVSDKNIEEWAGMNRPYSGARYKSELPKGEHLLQLYSLATPNGQKIAIMLEELLALGIKEAEYDAYTINIGEGEQFGSGYVEINPNSKIPTLIDLSGTKPINVSESGNILLYLAEKFGQFLPKELDAKTNVMNWLFWLQGSAPFLGGGFGHFYSYAQEKLEYPINRYSMEVKRQLDVLDKQLAKTRYLGHDEYSIADIATWPWYGNFVLGRAYNAVEFLQVKNYTNVLRWAEEIAQREAVQRGYIVNRIRGEKWECVLERHSAKDIDLILSYKP